MVIGGVDTRPRVNKMPTCDHEDEEGTSRRVDLVMGEGAE